MDYDFGNKRQYRRNIYAFANRYCDKPIKERKVFYIDTKEGEETYFLLARGYRPENLYVANNNPAEVAQLTKNLKKDFGIRVNTYGIEAGMAFCKVSDQKVYIDIYNLDYTCTITNRELEDDLYMLGAHILSGKHIVCVNSLRGREGKLEGRKFSEHSNGDREKADDLRAILVKKYLTFHAGVLDDFVNTVIDISGNIVIGRCASHILAQRTGVYRSTAGSQTMMWYAFFVEAHENVIDETEYYIKSEFGKESGDMPYCSPSINLIDKVAWRNTSPNQIRYNREQEQKQRKIKCKQ